MSAASVIEDAGYDFSDLDSDDSVTEVAEDKPSAKPGTSRGTTSSPAPASPRRGGRRPVKRLEALTSKLTGEMFMAGSMMGFMPVTGYYICQESRAFCEAVVELAAYRPEWIDALEHIANIQPGLVVGRTALGIGAAIAVDRDRAKADSAFMRFLGVYSAWKSIDDKRVPGEVIDGASNYRPPPVFTPVS